MCCLDPIPALLEKRGDPAQDLVDDLVGNPFDLPRTARAQIERAWLIATNDPGGLRAGAHERYCKTCHSSKKPLLPYGSRCYSVYASGKDKAPI
jgi:hypothetical protein